MTRIPCCVPYCRSTRQPMFGTEEEWICNKHYRAIPLGLRLEYEQAWKQADKADKRMADGLEVPVSVYTRVTAAFYACKAKAIELAGGN